MTVTNETSETAEVRCPTLRRLGVKYIRFNVTDHDWMAVIHFEDGIDYNDLTVNRGIHELRGTLEASGVAATTYLPGFETERIDLLHQFTIRMHGPAMYADLARDVLHEAAHPRYAEYVAAIILLLRNPEGCIDQMSLRSTSKDVPAIEGLRALTGAPCEHFSVQIFNAGGHESYQVTFTTLTSDRRLALEMLQQELPAFLECAVIDEVNGRA